MRAVLKREAHVHLILPRMCFVTDRLAQSLVGVLSIRGITLEGIDIAEEGEDRQVARQVADHDQGVAELTRVSIRWVAVASERMSSTGRASHNRWSR